MATIGIDLGATKISAAIFDAEGNIIFRTGSKLEKRTGREVGLLLTENIRQLNKHARMNDIQIEGIGLCVPGIYHHLTGTVWAPNIPGWDDYPLLEELKTAFSDKGLQIRIESDRTCYILGETWKGTARGCQNAIYLAVGTGIGAGILCDGHIIRGHGDIAGAVGWMVLSGNYDDKYRSCGNFEYYASGSGLVKNAIEIPNIRMSHAEELFEAYAGGNPVAKTIIEKAIDMWGRATANLISIFNPEIIVFGGGIFGPATRFIPRIREEAAKWAQPISMQQVRLEVSSLEGDAGLIGAGFLTLHPGN
jgi:glucokinase